jgi:hypothetical protein
VDAELLIAQLGESAYDEARQRALAFRMGATIDDGRSQDHWDCVRRLIGRKTGRKHVDTATRYLTE